MEDGTQSSLQNIEEEASVGPMSSQSLDEVSNSSEGQMNVPDYSDHQEQDIDSTDADQTEINDEDMIRKGTVTSARFNILSTMVSPKEFLTPMSFIVSKYSISLSFNSFIGWRRFFVATFGISPSRKRIPRSCIAHIHSFYSQTIHSSSHQCSNLIAPNGRQARKHKVQRNEII